MANIKQQKKRVHIAARQRMENLRYRSTIKTYFRRLQTALDNGDVDAATTEHSALVKLIDKAAARNALHPNNAARKKSRAARVLAAGPRVEAPKKRTRSQAASGTRRGPKRAAASRS